MKKKMKKVPSEAPPFVHPSVGEETRARSKFRALVRDYEDLVKETEDMRKRLQARKLKKSKLVAEVKFLRQKYQSLTRNKKQTENTLRMPKPKYRKPKKHTKRTSTIHGDQPTNTEIPGPSKFPLRERKHRDQGAAFPSTSQVLDLNKISIPSGDEVDFQVAWEPLRVAKMSKQHPVEADPAPTSCDLKLSACRNGRSSTGKRKISWQDQVALKV